MTEENAGIEGCLDSENSNENQNEMANVTANETVNDTVNEKKFETDTPSLETLRATLVKYGIEISESQTELMERFIELQWDWNTKINLTRHTTYEKFVTRDLIDTLAFSEFLAPDEKVLDVGSGSGVPGILLAILRPDVSVSLAECVGKKAKVLADIIQELQLSVPVYCGLGQDILGNWQFHTLTFRAVASMKKLLEWFRPCWAHFDRMLLVKGPKWVNERGEARHYSLFKGLALRKLKEYSIPGGEEVPEKTESEENLTSAEENSTSTEEGSMSVILQICPEEKIGKDSLCELSSLETSKSRNRYDHDRRRKSRVEVEAEIVEEVEEDESVEYVDADDFDGLDDAGNPVEIEKNSWRSRFGSKPNARPEAKREDRGKRSFRREKDALREERGAHSEPRGRRFDGNREGFGGREGRENREERGNREGFGGRSGGLNDGFRERRRFSGPRKGPGKGPRNSGGRSRGPRGGE